MRLEAVTVCIGGANDELFSSHEGGVNCLFLDGHAQFLSQDISGANLYYLCNPSDGKVAYLEW